VEQAVTATLTTTGQAILFTTLVLSAGFFVYYFATMVVLHNFGLLTAMTIIVALLADVLLAPALMVLVSRPQPVAAAISMEAAS
jgi:predicted RND superfamily exporter protein